MKATFMAVALMGMLLGANAGPSTSPLRTPTRGSRIRQVRVREVPRALVRPSTTLRLLDRFPPKIRPDSARLCSFPTSSRRDAARDARAHPRELVRRPPEHYGTPDRTPRGLRGTNIPMRSEPGKHRSERRREFSFSTKPPAAESLTSPPSTLLSPTTGEATASR